MSDYEATIRITFNVAFDDDGESNLRDQAIDAAKDILGYDVLADCDMEIVGTIEEANTDSPPPMNTGGSDNG